MGRRRGPNTDPSSISGQTGADIGGGGGIDTAKHTLEQLLDDGDAVSSRNQVYDMIPLSISMIPDDNAGFDGAIAEDPQDDDKIIVLPTGSDTDKVFTYDTKKDIYDVNEYDNTLALKDGFASGTVGKYVVIAGGDDGNRLADVDVLDTETGSWTNIDSLTTATERVAGATDDSYLYTFGGLTSTGVSQEIHRIDPETGTVDLLSSEIPLGGTDAGGRSAVVDGNLYITGYRDENPDGLSDDAVYFHRYDIEANTFERLADVDVITWDGGTPAGAAGGTLMKVNNDLLFYQDGNQYASDVNRGFYSISEDKWYGAGYTSATKDPDDSVGENCFVECNGILFSNTGWWSGSMVVLKPPDPDDHIA